MIVFCFVHVVTNEHSSFFFFFIQEISFVHASTACNKGWLGVGDVTRRKLQWQRYTKALSFQFGKKMNPQLLKWHMRDMWEENTDSLWLSFRFSFGSSNLLFLCSVHRSVNELYVDDPDKDSGGKIEVSLNISLPNLHCDCEYIHNIYIYIHIYTSLWVTPSVSVFSFWHCLWPPFLFFITLGSPSGDIIIHLII